MSLIAKEPKGGSGNFKQIPPGAYIARCYWIVDIGTQKTQTKDGVKSERKIQIGFEVFGDDDSGQPLTVNLNGKEMPLTVKRSLKNSLHEKANMRKLLASWRGRDFTPAELEGFDLINLINAWAMITITHSESNGKTYSNISSISPLPKQLKDNKPDSVHKNIIFNLSEPDYSVFNGFNEKLQDAIINSPEWAALQFDKQNKTDMDDAVPF